MVLTFDRCEGCREPSYWLAYVHGALLCRACVRRLVLKENWREVYQW
jgi:hypothetical protein